MAIIGEIRKRPTLIMVIIGLALLAFILGDLISKQFGGGVDESQAIMIEDEMASEEQYGLLASLVDFTKNSLLDEKPNNDKKLSSADVRAAELYGWIQFSEMMMIMGETDLLNIDVTDDELESLFYSGDEQTVASYMSRIVKWDPVQEGEAIQTWADYGKSRFENPQRQYEVKSLRIADKYKALLRTGFYATSLEAEKDHKAKNDIRKIKYAYKKFTEIPNGDYIPSDEEIKAYYKENKNDPMYLQDAGKTIELVEIPMVPSAKDREVVENKLERILKDNFAKSINDSAFVAQQKGDNLSPFAPVVKQVDSSQLVNSYGKEYYDQVVNLSNDTTVVFGPYETNGALNLLKIRVNHKRTVRHILLKSEGRSQQELYTLADSLYKVVSADTSKFDELVLKYSEDPGSKMTGGQYENFEYKTMVPNFSKFSFFQEIGAVGVVPTNYGLHIVEVLEASDADSSKFYTASLLTKKIMPLSGTIKEYKNKARDFEMVMAEGDFKAAADSNGYSVKEIFVAETEMAVRGFEDVTLMYDFFKHGDAGDISKPFTVGDRMYIARIKKAYDEGPMDQETAWERMKEDLMNQNKAEYLAGKAKGASSLDAVAQAWGTTIANKDMRFSDRSIGAVRLDNTPTDKRELYAVGAVFGKYQAGQMIPETIVGKEGVYMIEVLSDQAGAAVDYASTRDLLRKTYVSYMSSLTRPTDNTGLYHALKSFYNISDNRN